jgi:SynChlorMet cassette protein ScmD
MISLKERYLTKTDKPLANPLIVLREEFDDWAILFDPDTGHAFGINPTSAFIWKLLDGQHTVADILAEMRDQFTDVPKEAETHLQEFIDELMAKGLAGYQSQA